MKLTNADRDAFVNAALDDVPCTDFDELAQKLILDAIVDSMPPKVKAVYDDPSLRQHLRIGYITTPSPLRNVNVVCPFLWEDNCTKERDDKLKQFAEGKKAQDARRSGVRNMLKATIGGCTTLKQALERLPEFAKYLPADRDGARITSLPVVNLIAELTEMGWPKDAPLKAKP